jgi:hypothetical protein
VPYALVFLKVQRPLSQEGHLDVQVVGTVPWPVRLVMHPVALACRRQPYSASHTKKALSRRTPVHMHTHLQLSASSVSVIEAEMIHVVIVLGYTRCSPYPRRTTNVRRGRHPAGSAAAPWAWQCVRGPFPYPAGKRARTVIKQEQLLQGCGWTALRRCLHGGMAVSRAQQRLIAVTV